MKIRKSKTFSAGSVGALGLAAMLLGAPPARADLAFSWSGDCVVGCTGKASATLHLADDYVFGTDIADDNFVDLIFKSSTLNQVITTLDNPTGGINHNGFLVAKSVNFRNGDKVFAFQEISGGGLNWFATAPGGVLLRGLGDSRFTPTGISSIPEPSSWAMMLLGFAGLGFVGYHQTRRAKLQAG
jgi:hypothetical protein